MRIVQGGSSGHAQVRANGFCPESVFREMLGDGGMGVRLGRVSGFPSASEDAHSTGRVQRFCLESALRQMFGDGGMGVRLGRVSGFPSASVECSTGRVQRSRSGACKRLLP